MNRHLCVTLLLGLYSLLLISPAEAQETEEPVVLARFQEARALAADPRGRLYVADAGRDVVQVFDRNGQEQAALGQSGTRASEFDSPVDLDPTNGFTLVVADAGNGRIQRFSAELQYLEAIPIGRGFGDELNARVFDDGRDGSSVQGEGRPIAVASSNSNETFVIDGRDNVVVKFDEQRRRERILDSGNSPSVPQEPTALALDGDRRLYVADGERDVVLMYDVFGSFIGRVSVPSLPEIQALTVNRGRLWIVTADRVFVWEPSTEQTTEHHVNLDAPLVDIVQLGTSLFLLTSKRLLRRRAW